jgi:hypothetical protein
VVIRELAGTLENGYAIDVLMHRGSPEATLEELTTALAAVGYDLTEAFVSEWVNAAAKGRVVGALAGGSGGALSRDPLVVLIATGFGLVAGHLAGSFVHEEIARHHARRDPQWGTWHVAALEAPDTPYSASDTRECGR